MGLYNVYCILVIAMNNGFRVIWIKDVTNVKIFTDKEV